MIHYHGTPISPKSVLLTLKGRHFCVSFAKKADIRTVHEIGQSVMLDNGAFSAWTRNKVLDWNRYYAWCEKWMAPRTTWCVIPDVIDGSEEDNDALIAQWPHGHRGAPVWHLHESLERLEKLCAEWPRVCIGSSGQFRRVGSPAWHARMAEAMDRICVGGRVPTWLHLLRGMRMSGSIYPLASVDSTDIGRNHHLPGRVAADMAQRWDAMQCAGTWPSPQVAMREPDNGDVGVDLVAREAPVLP